MTHYVDLPDWISGPALVLVGSLFLLFARQYADTVWTMLTTDRSDLGTLPSDGTVEVEGRVHDVPDPLTAPVSGADCIAYEVSVDEYRRDPTDADHDITREWVDVDRVQRGTPFVLNDDVGTATVDPRPPDAIRCEVDTPEHETREVDEGEPPGLEAAVPDTGDDQYRRRYEERHLPTDADLYVLGTAADGGSRIDNEEGEPFVVSAGGERQAVLRHVAVAVASGVIGVAGIAFGGYLTLSVFNLV